MKRPGPVMRLAAPLKVLAHRFTFLGFAAAAVGMMVLGKAEAPLVERARMHVVDAFIPILDAMARPAAAVINVTERINEIVHVHAENAKLREENARLLQWQNVARKLEAENQSLRGLVNFVPEGAINFISARVVADAGGSFVRSIVVAAGTDDGVNKGLSAVTDDGLVGRVGEVGLRSARILLITDLNSQVPVLVEGSRERGILSGDNSDRPRLMFLAAAARPQIGDRIVTSGHGGVFPPGLPVGVVVATGDSGVRVRPYVEFHRLEHVRLLDYGLGGTLPVAAPPPASRRGR